MRSKKRKKDALTKMGRSLRRQRLVSCAFFLLPFALLVLPASVSVRAEKIEQLSPSGYVNDFANVLDADARQKLAALCQEVDQKADAQIAVVTIRSLDGDAVEDFTNRLAEKWGVGPKTKDRGVMILLAVDDHRDRVEVGYGLEAILPDGKVGGFERDMAPLLRQSQYGAALLQITAQVAAVIAQDRGVALAQSAPSSPPNPGQPSSEGPGAGWFQGFLLLLFFGLFGWRLLAFLFAMAGLSRYRRGSGYRGGGWMGPTGGWNGGGGGGNWGGGGFGGFGGGSFGGGGASGSW